jgi:hypothetical protein
MRLNRRELRRFSGMSVTRRKTSGTLFQLFCSFGSCVDSPDSLFPYQRACQLFVRSLLVLCRRKCVNIWTIWLIHLSERNGILGEPKQVCLSVGGSFEVCGFNYGHNLWNLLKQRFGNSKFRNAFITSWIYDDGNLVVNKVSLAWCICWQKKIIGEKQLLNHSIKF